MLDTLNKFIKLAKDCNIAVIGETILDEFIPVSYEGQSMKSLCPVFKVEGESIIQQGGASAIASHLSPFVKSVKLFTNTNNEIIKTRHIDINNKQKHVEINKFDTKNFHPIKIKSSDFDLVIVADFGHKFCDQLNIDEGFHLMCQTNSNNFGFNRISKWKALKKKSICLDLREASLQINEKFNDFTDQHATKVFNYEINSQNLFVTLGASGSLYTNGKIISRLPSFKTEVVDTIGAGDTFFAFSSLVSHLELPDEDKLLIPSLAASLSTTWLCNAESVTPEKLIQHANRYI